MPVIGGTVGRDPVAITNTRALRARAPTTKVRASLNAPCPTSTSTPSERKRSGLSLGAISLITAATRCITAVRFSADSCAGNPHRCALRMACATLADLSSVFDGTQPYQRQSPPSLCFSTNATLAPSDAAPAATARPPAPPPITTISNSGRTESLRPRD